MGNLTAYTGDGLGAGGGGWNTIYVDGQNAMTTDTLEKKRVSGGENVTCELTAHGVKVKQYLGDNNSCVNNHQQTENNLNRTTLERLNRPPSTSAPHNHAPACTINNDNNDNS